jgi:hypothetical protein
VTAAMLLRHHNNVSEALRILELGRGAIIGAQVNGRSDITDLEMAYPELSEQFRRLSEQFEGNRSDRVEMNITALDMKAKSLPVSDHPRRHEINSEFESLIDTIRRKPGFEGFLRGILEWLWNVAVEPVLTELGFTETPLHDDEWPHIWWVPVGRLNVLPFHAAGYHTIPERSTIERVISPYVPTIRALGYARQQVDNLQHQHIVSQKFVMVAMSTTPNQLPLPFANREVDAIESILPSII